MFYCFIYISHIIKSVTHLETKTNHEFLKFNIISKKINCKDRLFFMILSISLKELSKTTAKFQRKVSNLDSQTKIKAPKKIKINIKAPIC